MTTFERVYAAVRLIPRGSVATYGQIARAIGNPRLARVVGYALHVNPEPRCRPPSPSAARTDRWSCLKTRAWDLRTRAMWIWHASAYGRCRTSWNRKTPCFYG